MARRRAPTAWPYSVLRVAAKAFFLLTKIMRSFLPKVNPGTHTMFGSKNWAPILLKSCTKSECPIARGVSWLATRDGAARRRHGTAASRNGCACPGRRICWQSISSLICVRCTEVDAFVLHCGGRYLGWREADMTL